MGRPYFLQIAMWLALATIAVPAVAGFHLYKPEKPPAVRTLTDPEEAEIAAFDAALAERRLSGAQIDAGLARIERLYAESYGVTHSRSEERRISEIKALDGIGDHRRAASRLEHAVALARAAGEPDKILGFRLTQREWLIRAGRRHAAVRLLRRAFTEKAAGKSPDALAIARIRDALAADLTAVRRFAEADAELRTALATYIAERGRLSDPAMADRQAIAANLRAWGRTEEAKAAQADAEHHADLLLSLYADRVEAIATRTLAAYTASGQRAAAIAAMDRALRLARMHQRQVAAEPIGLSEPRLGFADLDWLSRYHSTAYHKIAPTFGVALDLFEQLARADPADRERLGDAAFQAAQDAAVSATTIASLQIMARQSAANDALRMLVREQQDATARFLDIAGQAKRKMAYKKSSSEERRAFLTDAVAALEHLYDVDDRLRHDDPGYFERAAPHAIGIEAARGVLAEDEAVLMLVPHGPDIYQIGLSRHGLAWRRIDGGLAGAERRIGLLGCQLDPASCPRSISIEIPTASEARGYRRFDRAAAYGLYRDLVAPVEPAFGPARRVYVLAGGALGALPLATLLTDAPAPGDDADPALLAAAPWLSDRYAFTSIVSVEALTLARTGTTAGAPTSPGASAAIFRGFGAPSLLGDGAATRARGIGRVRITRSAGPGGLMMADPDSLRRLEPLPGTRIELEAMAKALSAAPDALRLGDAASEAAVRGDSSIADVRIIAFATHGVLPGELSGVEEPGLILTPPARATTGDDGFLAASEVAELRLGADWLILSACNTATADGLPGADSLSSLARAFLYAGAGALLASHWRISDVVTASLTVETLAGNRHDSLSRARSLQQAMRAIRLGKRADGSAVPGWSPDWSHPSAWAPFTIIANRDR